MPDKTVLITGAAGFIGHHLSFRLLSDRPDLRIVGMDDLDDYYDPRLKERRLALLSSSFNESGWTFIKGDIADSVALSDVFSTYHPSIVINLAARAGVRCSAEDPGSYLRTNVDGFFNVLQECRKAYGKGFEHLIFASSSSVYGESADIPFSLESRTDHPESFYAATKKAMSYLLILTAVSTVSRRQYCVFSVYTDPPEDRI